MSDRGYCNYCGKYRPLTYNGGYCCKKCYVESGQQESDSISEANYQDTWYYSTSKSSIIKRTVLLTIQWSVIYLFCYAAMEWNMDALSNLPSFLVFILSPLPLLYMPIIFLVISLVQNIIANPKGPTLRKVIFYLPQVLMFAGTLVAIKSGQNL